MFETRDGVHLRSSVFKAPDGPVFRGVCVLLQGQTEFIEKYGEVIVELGARGFTVATFDWRGQGGSQRALGDPRKAHVANFSQYDDDLRAFMDVVVRPLTQEPPIAFAHSMGGHILLRYLHSRPNDFKAAVLTAPMLRVSTRGKPERLAQPVAAFMNFIAARNEFVWGADVRDPLARRFEGNMVTSDRARFARTQALLAAKPGLGLAGPTWGWLSAAFASMNRINAKGYAEKIETPVLLVGAGHDQVVQTQAVRDFAKRLPHCTYIEIADAEHEILMENDSIRSRFWNAFDRFLADLKN